VNKRRWSNRWRSIGSSVIVLLVACGLPASASAAPTKPFEVTLTPAQVPAGVTVGAYTVTLTNETGTQQLGSADVTVPGAFTVVSQPTLNRPGTVSESDKVLHLRTLNLPPGASVTATVGLRMTCVSGAYTWKAAAKQSNDFNGPPGNNLGPVKGSLTTTVTGSCALRFVTHPADSEKNESIRATAFAPTSSQLVTVEAVDGSASPARLAWFNAPVTIGLAPTSYLGRLDSAGTSATANAGLASFPNLRVDASGVYELRATTTAAGFVAGDSVAFKIVDVAESCASASCTARLAGRQSTSALTAAPGSSTGVVALSLNLGPEPICAGYVPPGPDWYEFALTATRDKTILTTFTKQAMRDFGSGPSALEICFAAPVTFAAKDGGPQPFDYDGDPANGAEGFVGKLPDCPQASPCATARSGISGGGAQITFAVPAAWGDPRYH
jgi:hypothetical protein